MREGREKRKEIRKYGIFLAPGDWVLVFAGIVAAGLLMRVMFELELLYTLILLAGMVILSVETVQYMLQYRYERARYLDVSVYMEQMIYAFRDTQKVLCALENVLILFPEGVMHRCLAQAIRLIEKRTDKGPAEQLALQLIEQEYPCERLHRMHEYMLNVEWLGGDFSNSLELLLRDYRLWLERVREADSRRKKYRRDILFSILFSIGICVAELYLLPERADIRPYEVTQVTWVALIFVNMLVFLLTEKKLSGNLFQNWEPGQNAVRKYEQCMRYDKKTGAIHSFLFSLFPFALAAASAISGLPVVSAGCLLTGVFLLFQHKLGYALAVRTVRREITRAFPQWLMQLGLLLQSENVQVSIARSEPLAPQILRPAIRKMVQEMEYEPESEEPFLHFLDHFRAEGVTPAMRMLYSVSAGCSGEPVRQIGDIVERIQNEYDLAQRQKEEYRYAGMYLLFLIPYVAGMLKLAFDMSVFILVYFTTFGSGVPVSGI